MSRFVDPGRKKEERKNRNEVPARRFFARHRRWRAMIVKPEDQTIKPRFQRGRSMAAPVCGSARRSQARKSRRQLGEQHARRKDIMCLPANHCRKAILYRPI